MTSLNPGRFIFGLLALLWVHALGNPTWAQDARLAAVRGLERAVQGSGGSQLPWELIDLAKAYEKMGAQNDASRLLAQAASLAELSTKPGDRERLLAQIGDGYLPLDEADRKSIQAGDKQVLQKLLVQKNTLAIQIPVYVGWYVTGVASRDGLEAAKQAVVELDAFVKKTRAEGEALATNELVRGWNLAQRQWLAALLKEACRTNKVADLIGWTRRAMQVDQRRLEDAMTSAAMLAQKSGDASVLIALLPHYVDHDQRINAIELTAVEALRGGQTASATTAARLITGNSTNMASAMRVLGLTESIDNCTGPRKPLLTIDPDYFFARSGFVDCGAVSNSPALLSLGIAFARARQDAIAQSVLDYTIGVDPNGRGEYVNRSEKCPPSDTSLKLAMAYYRVGATELVKKYVEHASRACKAAPWNAYFVGWILTLLSSPDDVPRLVREGRVMNEAVPPKLYLGMAAGLTERNLAAPLSTALHGVEDKTLALTVVHDSLTARRTVERTSQSAEILRTLFAVLGDHYLKADEGNQNRFLMTPQWMVDYAQAGLGGETASLVSILSERTTQDINARLAADTTGRSLAGDVVRARLVGLATLFLAARLTDPRTDPDKWAARIENKGARDVFLALTCEALALTGDFDGGARLAQRLTVNGSRLEPNDFVPGQIAWRALAIARAQRGDLGAAYVLARDKKAPLSVGSLLSLYDGMR